MEIHSLRVTAWNNGSHHSSGAGYGLKVARGDISLFSKWESVVLHLEGETSPVIVNINKKSFWNGKCRELIKKEIGQWLIRNKKAPWPKGNPPHFLMRLIKENLFEIKFNLNV